MKHEYKLVNLVAPANAFSSLGERMTATSAIEAELNSRAIDGWRMISMVMVGRQGPGDFGGDNLLITFERPLSDAKCSVAVTPPVEGAATKGAEVKAQSHGVGLGAAVAGAAMVGAVMASAALAAPPSSNSAGDVAGSIATEVAVEVAGPAIADAAGDLLAGLFSSLFS